MIERTNELSREDEKPKMMNDPITNLVSPTVVGWADLSEVIAEERITKTRKGARKRKALVNSSDRVESSCIPNGVTMAVEIPSRNEANIRGSNVSLEGIALNRV